VSFEKSEAGFRPRISREHGIVVGFGIVLMVLLVPPRGSAQSQVVNQNNGPGRSQDMPQADVALEIKGTVKVTIQADKTRGFMAPRALGMASSAADNHLLDPLMPQILQSAGVSTLRYPGGSYSDTITGPPTSPQNCRDRTRPNTLITLPVTISVISSG
jgi:hypothetical protein